MRRSTAETEISIVLTNSNNVNVLFSSLSDGNNQKFVELKSGLYQASVWIKEIFLLPDNYTVQISAHCPNKFEVDMRTEVIRFSLLETGSTMGRYGTRAKSWSCVLGGTKWDYSLRKELFKQTD